MKLVIFFVVTVLALSLVLESSSATCSDKKQSKKATAIIEDLQSLIQNSPQDSSNSRALSRFSGGGAYIQQRPIDLLQLQLVLRDLIRAIARLESNIRNRRRG